MRVLAINNLRSGQGDVRRYDAMAEIANRAVELTVRPVDAAHSLETALEDASSFDRVVTFGGDGTVSAAAYALRDTGVPLLAYPAGTANAIALNLGITPDPARAVDLLFDGASARIDVGEFIYDEEHRPPRGGERRATPRLTGRLTMGFIAMAGVGADAEMMHKGAELKPQFGPAAYLMATLANPYPQIARITLDMDGRHIETEGSAVLLVNFARMQFDLTLTHDSNAQDGMLEVVVVKVRHIAELLPAVAASYLDKIVTYPSRTQAFDTYRARSVRIACEPTMRAQADGEVLTGGTPLECRVLPGAATFIVPHNADLPGVRVV